MRSKRKQARGREFYRSGRPARVRGKIQSMKILAFDTSTHWLSVACGDGLAWVARAEHAGEGSSERVLPLVDAVLREAGIALRDLDGIAFGAGPGSFTGVRIACGVAQGLALGAGLSLVPVSTLEALAQGAWRDHGAARVVACLDARMREVYAAAYERGADGWQERHAPSVVLPQDATLAGVAGWVGVGDGFAAYPALGTALALSRVEADARPDARAIGALALPRLAAGEGVAASAARPLYVRHRVALTIAERAAGLRM
jgi:tRNA threonylcarbamoyladenosine biosynthesis protein TsaB